MAVTDPIADFLTRIRNAQMAGHKVVEISASNMKKKITELLYEHGYILKYKFEDIKPQGVIKIAIKYNLDTKKPVIKEIKRLSTPGLRKYVGVSNIPRIKNGLGMCIISTSKGLMSGVEATKENLGGELVCYVH